MDENKPLSEAQEKLAYRAYQGHRPKRRKYKKLEIFTCGNCGTYAGVNYVFCINCGFRILWDIPSCLTK